MVSRRQFFGYGASLLPAAAAFGKSSEWKVGVTDWNLGLTGKVEAVALAKQIGFNGVEVSLGRKAADNKLPMDNPELQDRYLSEFAKHHIEIAGTCLDILHVNYLKNDKLGQKWVADGIRVSHQLKAKVMLLPFFGKGALTTPEEMDYVADALKELAPEAEKVKLYLGLEDTISADDNLRIINRIGSKMVKVYYDVGNSTKAHFDVIKEIRQLGAKQICQIHLKDEGYLGEGKIDFQGVIKAIHDIGFHGFSNLETGNPSKQVDADMRRNLTFVRRMMTENHAA